MGARGPRPESSWRMFVATREPGGPGVSVLLDLARVVALEFEEGVASGPVERVAIRLEGGAAYALAGEDAASLLREFHDYFGVEPRGGIPAHVSENVFGRPEPPPRERSFLGGSGPAR